MLSTNRKSLIGLTVLLVVAGCDASEPATPNRVLVGVWGGDNAGVVVSDTSAHVHIGCTKGDIQQVVLLDPDGRFDVPGDHNIDAYPVDRGILHPARFIGSVEGRRMTLTVVLQDTLVTLGPVVVEFERQPEMQMCPICREPEG